MGAMGQIKGFNPTTFAMIMNNKFGDEYKRGTGSNTEVTITNNTLKLSSDEVQAKIEQKINNLQKLGVDLARTTGTA